MAADTRAPSTGYLVWRLAAKWRAGLDRALGPLGLTSARYGVLASLHGLIGGGTQPSQRELAHFVGFEPMFVSTIARTLERDGLIERRAHAQDPRAWQLRLTPRGVKVLSAARAIVVQLEERRLQALGGHDSARSVALRESLLALLTAAATIAPEARAPEKANRRTRAAGRSTRNRINS